MSENYEGPITVHLDDGPAEEGHAELHDHRDGALKAWEGTITFEYPIDIPFDADVTLVMPDNRTGKALAIAADHENQYMEIRGTGPAPWDTGL